MNKTRIAFREIPELLADILSDALVDQSDLECLGMLESQNGLVDEIESNAVDILMLGGPEAEAPEVWNLLLRRFPRLKIFSINRQGRCALLHELRPRCSVLGDVSLEELFEVIRDFRADLQTIQPNEQNQPNEQSQPNQQSRSDQRYSLTPRRNQHETTRKQGIFRKHGTPHEYIH